jgi:hypothetical protein
MGLFEIQRPSLFYAKGTPVAVLMEKVPFLGTSPFSLHTCDLKPEVTSGYVSMHGMFRPFVLSLEGQISTKPDAAWSTAPCAPIAATSRAGQRPTLRFCPRVSSPGYLRPKGPRSVCRLDPLGRMPKGSCRWLPRDYGMVVRSMHTKFCHPH